MKKLKLFLLAGAILMLAAPVCAWGAPAGSKATGAKLPTYKKVVVRTVDVSTRDKFSTSMAAHLEEAAKKASKTTQYKIVIPPGTYTARYGQNVPSNTWIYAKGATIRALKGKKRMVLLTNQKFGKATENIKIEGGTWDTTTQSVNDSPETAPFRFAHTKNLIFQDMTIKCNRKAHLIELADINRLTVKGCKISGNHRYSGVQPKEAIQLDVATEKAMVNMRPYNGKGCHNVIIENNRFNNVARGVGSHNEKEKIVEANPYTHVTVKNNSFNNLKAEAVFITWWQYCTVEKNTVENGQRAGVYMESSSKVRVTNNNIKKITAFSGDRRRTYGSATAGIILRGSHKNYIRNNTVSRCKGKIVRKENICRGNSIKNNKKK
ncbi:MAG: right-handed parallel beta-helix repeat-containing protein [Lachnospiraceae bacterium]|nr:right-handed parallel beta-helix repeat-containing protein [Lachnospiraceae bacterium]